MGEPPSGEMEHSKAGAPEKADGDDDDAAEKERQLLLSMGWDPDDDGEEGGLEEWEIEQAQEGFMEHLAQGQGREGLRERAQREFEAWKAEQGAHEEKACLQQVSSGTVAVGDSGDV